MHQPARPTDAPHGGERRQQPRPHAGSPGVQQEALTPESVLQLQRAFGNSAVTRLVLQRKPADIDRDWTLSYDNSGKLLNVPAPRRGAGRRSAIINALVTKGWVTPGDLLKGGHLFKAQFGGHDDDTNVVPWLPATESAFALVEDEYKAAADEDAADAAQRSQPFTASVRTHATFVDRPDLELTDTQLDAAGWPQVDAARDARKKQYADVADQLSGIPTHVSVKVTGLSKGDKEFTRSTTDISPAYAQNPDAIKPGYVLPGRFTRNATAARNFQKVRDWPTYAKAKPKAKADSDVVAKLNHVATRHGADFGVAGLKMSDLEALETTLATFVGNPSNEQIEGVYLLGRIDACFYVGASGLMVAVDTSGLLISGWKLTQTQHDKLLATGELVSATRT